MSKHYYAGYSYMGVNMTYDSPCWTLYAFDSKEERNEWISENEYDNGNIKAESVTRREAERIMGGAPKDYDPWVVDGDGKVEFAGMPECNRFFNLQHKGKRVIY